MSTGYKLKKGDQVVMHTCMEHDHPDYFGKVWVCRGDEFKHKGHNYGSVMLEGFSGSFSTEFLQKVNLEGSALEVERLRKELEEAKLSSDRVAASHRYMEEELIKTERKLELMTKGIEEIAGKHVYVSGPSVVYEKLKALVGQEGEGSHEPDRS